MFFICSPDVVAHIIPILRHILKVSFCLTLFAAPLYRIGFQRKEMQNAVYKYNQKAFHNKHLFYANILFY